MRNNRAYLALISALLSLSPVLAGEYHGGAQSVCSDCHITHASKDGQEYIVVQTLLKHPQGEVGLCMSCHDGTDTNAPDIVSSGTSVSPGSAVTTSYASKYGSSAGFFQSDYGSAANPSGHDLNSSGTVTAPLSGTFAGGLKCSSCHDPHGTPNYRNLKIDPNPNHPGSAQILLGTHVKQTVPVNATTPNPAQAYDTGNVGWFTANNISQWCTDCHDQLATNINGSSPAHFMGHPSNVAINMAGGHTDVPNWTAGTIGTSTGFGTDIGDAAAGIPRLRFGSSTGSPNESAANDTVTCLSCHKAHGSKHKSGLNWPYRTNTPDQLAGCQQCHYK